MEKAEDKPSDRPDFTDNKGKEKSESDVKEEDMEIDNKSFPSKRKKDNESNPVETNQSGIHYEWKQTITDVQLLLTHNLEPDQLKDIDAEFTDTGVYVKFPDGRNWFCIFYGEIERESSKVLVRKTKLTLITNKKVAAHWPTLEATKSSSDVGTDIISDTAEEVLTVPSPSSGFFSDLDSVSVTPMPSETSTATSDNLPELVTDDKDGSSLSDDELPDLVADDRTDTVDQDKSDSVSDNKEFSEKDKPQEESKSYHLQHVKHDYIEKDETFVVHIYVKAVDKDTCQVNFEEKLVTVKFRTSDERFLRLHEGTNNDTNFVMKFHLAHEVLPSKCSYRVTGVMIELHLSKAKVMRWNVFEAVTRKESTPQARSVWIPTKTQSTVQTSSATGKSNVIFDELKDVKVAKRDEAEQESSSYDSHRGGATGVTNMQKPTCKVSPMNKNAMDMERVTTPGFTGLDNLGNTCFMNSVLQALANSREFRDFFLDCSFQKDINTDNPLGSKGQLAVSFAILLKVLWSGKHYSYAPSKLKNLIAMKASQFTGFAQHDSQEFMAFLLDGLHEDLNRVRKKPYTETVDSDGRPDHVVANEAWEVYKKRNDSFIVDLFQGQYKSKLVCPVCGKVSITFDPFLYLSVPLPKKKHVIPIRFMWKDPYKKPVLLRLRLAKDATTETLKESAAKKTGVSPKDMRVFEAYRGKIYKFYDKMADLSCIQADDTIIIAETLSEEIAGENVHEIYVIQRTMMPNQLPTRCSYCKRLCPEGSKLKRCTKCFKVGYCDQSCQKSHWSLHKCNCKPVPEPVGWPFVLSIPESRATYSRLCKLMEAYARYSVDVFQPPVKNEGSKLISQSSTSSNLSSSSQSSGSMSSLDSQSSCSSTCTIVADQEKEKENDNVRAEPEDGSGSGSSLEAQAGSGDSCGSMNGTYCCGDGSYSATNMPPCIVDSDVQLGEEDHDYGERNLPESRTFKMPPVETLRPSMSTYKDNTSCKDQENEPIPLDNEKTSTKTIPTKPVLGIQKGDADRVTPLFFIKPVNQDGAGLKGPEGERLDDKGDVPLDLTDKQFLSMDWKNHEKFDPYVLIQSKELDCDEDTSDPNPVEENPNITLDQCLELFTEPEILNPDEAWYCPQCKEHREASKQMSIWKLPHTLIIQLKRFSFRNFIWRDKIDKMVEFPTRGLDLSPYFVGSGPPDEQTPIYDLYAVVNHYGGILGGHYTSFVRCADLMDSRRNEVPWRLCDDSRVTTIINENSVVTRGAYLLFYRRRTPFVPPKPLPPVEEQEPVEQDESPPTLNANSNSDSVGTDKEKSISPSDNIKSDTNIGIQNVDLTIEKEINTDDSEETPLLGSSSNKYIQGYLGGRNYRKEQGEDSDEDEEEDSDTQYAGTRVTSDIGFTDMDEVD